MVPINPVKDVEESVKAEGRDVVRGDVFNDANFVQHPDLGDEGNGLEPETETPGHLPGRPAGVHDAGAYNCGRDECEQMREIVARFVVGLIGQKEVVTYGAEGLLVAHQVDDEAGRGNEEYLHRGVVERNEIHEQVHVARDENDQVNFLRLA